MFRRTRIIFYSFSRPYARRGDNCGDKYEASPFSDQLPIITLIPFQGNGRHGVGRITRGSFSFLFPTGQSPIPNTTLVFLPLDALAFLLRQVRPGILHSDDGEGISG